MNDTPVSPASPEEAAAPEAEPAVDTGTTVYKRTGRVPTLGFWVLLAILVPVVVALVASPFLQLGDFSGVVTLALDAAIFVGVPLAAIVCLVEALVLRSRSRRTRR